MVMQVHSARWWRHQECANVVSATLVLVDFLRVSDRNILHVLRMVSCDKRECFFWRAFCAVRLLISQYSLCKTQNAQLIAH